MAQETAHAHEGDPLNKILSSGVDHSKVAAANPNWDVNDWCWYWHRDAMKIEKKENIKFAHLETDCGAGCLCAEKLGVR